MRLKLQEADGGSVGVCVCVKQDAKRKTGRSAGQDHSALVYGWNKVRDEQGVDSGASLLSLYKVGTPAQPPAFPQPVACANGTRNSRW